MNITFEQQEVINRLEDMCNEYCQRSHSKPAVMNWVNRQAAWAEVQLAKAPCTEDQRYYAQTEVTRLLAQVIRKYKLFATSRIALKTNLTTFQPRLYRS